MIVLTENQLHRVQSALSHIEGGAEKAMARAINRSADMAKTDGVRKATEEYTIKAARVRQTFSISKATPGRLVASVVSSDRAIGLENFKISPARPGKFKKGGPVLHVQVLKSGGMKPLPHAFVIRASNGNIGVFERVGRGGKRAGRLPIEKKFGPAIPMMLGTQRVRIYIEEKAAENIDKRLEHEIGRMLGEKQ